MLLEEERYDIVYYGRKLITSNLTTGSGGNLSIYNREQGLVAIKHSGIDYFDMRPEDVMVMTIEVEIVEGEKKPSSEVNFHLGSSKTPARYPRGNPQPFCICYHHRLLELGTTRRALLGRLFGQ